MWVYAAGVWVCLCVCKYNFRTRLGACTPKDGQDRSAEATTSRLTICIPQWHQATPVDFFILTKRLLFQSLAVVRYCPSCHGLPWPRDSSTVIWGQSEPPRHHNSPSAIIPVMGSLCAHPSPPYLPYPTYYVLLTVYLFLQVREWL